jgi:hypothetical protein
MKNLNLLFLVIFLFPLFSIAQSNYKPGYVVTLKGDTLRGFIDYRGWNSNPDAISFKTAADSRDIKRFTTADIDFFNVGDFESYKKCTCSVSEDGTNISNLSTARDTSFSMETVFLKVLQKGKNVALYSFTDDLKTRFYLGETPDYKPAELIYRIYNNSNNGTKFENGYLKTLFALAIKYNVLDDGLSKTFQLDSYNSAYILGIVSKINHISIAEEKKNYSQKSEFKLFLDAGLNIGSASSSTASSYTLGGGGPYTSYLPEFSVGLNMVPNPESGKIEFRVEVMYAESEFNSTYQLKVSPYIAMRASFNQTAISLVPQIIYNFYNAQNLKVFVGLGVDFTHFSYSNSYFGSKDPNVSDNGIGETDPFAFNSTDNSFIIKAGVKLHKNWEVYFNYVASTATTQGGYFGLNNSSKQIGLLYFFGK